MEDDHEEINSGKPTRFVYFDDENGKFKVDPDAIELLQQIKGPVAVVSVCGPVRQGKSFILNQLLGRRSGFPVGTTHQPCTKGLWMWSIPLKKTALDGTEYNLLLFDSGGINDYDQTGTCSTQLFALAVLFSSLFIYNQVGVIDEAALNHLSLVTEMTKHIHRRASEGKNLVFELGHFSPFLVWLLRDFYLDLTEHGAKIKPHDYLELTLRPVMGSGSDVSTKNQIRESIRAVFPSRECFTLFRPLNNETNLQHLDRVSLDKYRPEFQTGVDAFANFVYERTKPKQVGDTIMTGPLLASITKSFLDVLHSGSAPIVSFSWQVCMRDSSVETELQCSNAVQSMEKKLQDACAATNARIEDVFMVLENLLSEYEESIHGPTKWQKLFSFLQKSLQGPILHYAQKLMNEASLEKFSILLNCRSLEYNVESLHKQLETSEKSKTEYQKRYEAAINDFKRLSDQYKSRITDTESKFVLLEERCSSSLEMLDSAKQETLEWKRIYEEILTAKRAHNDQANANTALNPRTCEAKARADATAEQFHLALKEANEWKEKYDIATSEAKAFRERTAEHAKHFEERAKRLEEDMTAADEQSQLALKETKEWKDKYDIAINEAKSVGEKAAEQAKLVEEDLTSKFTKSLAEKDEEIKDKVAMLEDFEQKLTSLTLDLKAGKTKIENYILESSALKLQVKELAEKYNSVKAASQSMEREIQSLVEDRTQLEQNYQSLSKRLEEAHDSSIVAKEEVEVTNKFNEAAQAEEHTAQNEKHNPHQRTMDGPAHNSSDSHTQNLEGEQMDLACEFETSNLMSEVAILKAMVRKRDEEIELLKKKCDQCSQAVPILERNLESEHAANLEVNKMEKEPSIQLEPVEEGSKFLQQESTPDHTYGYAQDSGLKTYSGRKHSRSDDMDVSLYSVKIETDELGREMKKPKSSSALVKCTTAEMDFCTNSSEEDGEQQKAASVDYTKISVWKLRQELVEHGFGEELQKLRYPKKKEIIALYEKYILKK